MADDYESLINAVHDMASDVSAARTVALAWQAEVEAAPKAPGEEPHPDSASVFAVVRALDVLHMNIQSGLNQYDGAVPNAEAVAAFNGRLQNAR